MTEAFKLNWTHYGDFLIDSDPTGLVGKFFFLNNLYNNLILNSAEFRLRKQPNPKPNLFLSHHQLTTAHRYADEPPIFNGLLYSEMVCFIDRLVAGNGAKISIKPERGLFNLEPIEDPNFEAQREEGFEALKKAGKYRYDSDTIRLNHLLDDGDTTVLTIQKALYSQQARSNLILDFVGDTGKSLRSVFQAQYGCYLPPLVDKRLAQTIGVSLLLFYMNDGKLIPFFVPRSREVAVLNEGDWSDSASGAAEWPKDEANTPITFEEYILDDMYMELREELELYPEDLTNILPLAIAREYIRGGKPQIFFIGFTKLTYNELVARMETAREKTKNHASIPNEMYKMPAFRKSPVTASAKSTADDAERIGLDPQAAVSLYYAHRFFEAAKQSNRSFFGI